MTRARMFCGLLVSAMWFAHISTVYSAVLEPKIHYTTTGTIGDRGRNGSSVIEFAGLTNAAFYDASSGGTPQMPSPSIPEPGQWSFSLGDFRLTTMQPGSSTSFNETPFEIQVHIDGDTVQNFSLGGTLTGSADPVNGADLKIVFNNEAVGVSGSPQFVFESSGLTHRILGVADGRLLIQSGGSLTLRSYITPQPVPEPASILLFSPLVVVAVRRLRRTLA